MEHMAPITHAAEDLDVVTEAQMRKPSVSSLEKPQVMEREWGFAARIDSTVTFEEYYYWAKIEREMEVEENKVFQSEHGSPLKSSIKARFSKDGREQLKAEREQRLAQLQTSTEKNPAPITQAPSADDPNAAMKVTDAEWRVAARALRTASWGQMFFLITTDILGWSGAP